MQSTAAWDTIGRSEVVQRLDFDTRVREAERLVDRYIREKKEALARMALETLLDLYPNHPRRSDLESWVGLLGQEVEAERRAEERLAEARQAVARGDLEVAEKLLGVLEKEAPSERFAEALRAEIAEAARLERTSAAAGERRARLEALLEAGRLAEAERQLEELERVSDLEITKVSLDGYRSRLAQLRSSEHQERRRRELEGRYQERLAARDWSGAREVALDLDRAVPDSRRPAELFAEVARLEQAERRRASIEQGVRQVEEHLAAGQMAEAELGLTILARMAPDEPQVGALERRLRQLKAR